MKTIFRFSGLAVLTAAFIGAATTATFAQDPCADADGQTALYGKFTELYPKPDLESRKAAIEAAKQFVEKYGTCEGVKEQNEYFKGAIPKLEEAVKKIEESRAMGELFKRFDAAVGKDPASSKPDEAYAAGKEIVAKQPENINVIVALGMIGASQSTAANNYKYSGDGLQYANLALSKVKSGAKFTKKNPKGEEVAGVFWTEMTRPDLVNELTYAVAYLTYFGKKDKQAALPLYYELSQGAFKDDPRIYGTIGDYYLEQRKPIAEQIRVKIAEQSAAGTTEERKLALEEEIKKLVALFNGYNERILDAYGRAYKVTKDTPANKAYRDNLYKIMQEVYKARFEKEAGLNEYISATVSKPFPNPTSEVTPVSDPEPVKTTGSTTGTTPTTAQPAGTNGTAANGSTTATTKPAVTKPAANDTTAATTKPATTAKTAKPSTKATAKATKATATVKKPRR